MIILNSEAIIDYRSLITEQKVREKIEEYMLDPNILGIMLWGSRATGFSSPDSDWDALLLVENEYYDSLSILETAYVVTEGEGEQRRVLIDFSLWSEECAQQILESPHDIDHWAWVEGLIIYDPQLKMSEWKTRIAKYPEEEHEERLKSKFVQLVVARYYAMTTHKRGLVADSKINLYRAILCAINLWFSLKKSWTPSLKWWSKHVKQMDMPENIFNLFISTLEAPTLKKIIKIEKYLKNEIIKQGYDFPDDFLSVLLETVHKTGRSWASQHCFL
jgi:predicted nucleotidyltransferase